jgi:hypothetical protein
MLDNVADLQFLARLVAFVTAVLARDVGKLAKQPGLAATAGVVHGFSDCVPPLDSCNTSPWASIRW